MDKLEQLAKEDKQTKEKFLEYWDKELKRVEQKADEGFMTETMVRQTSKA